MTLPNLLPPRDLLEQVEGVEKGLRQGRRLGALGWAAFIVFSALQVTYLLYPWLASLLHFPWKQVLDLRHLYVPLSVFTLVLFVLLVNWHRFWLKESQEPFQYTYAIADFTPIAGAVPEKTLAWLRYDLSERLSERIKRLSLLEVGGGADPAGRQESHIHIAGDYVIRDGVVEVTPRVRIGPRGKPETLAHQVRMKLRDLYRVDEEDYKKIRERIYFSVATQIYKQIREDVQRKIDLLPTDYFRAVAYFREADDYARSNTLEAYDDARKLYSEAMQLYDPRWRPPAQSRFLQGVARLTRWWADILRKGRRTGAAVFPSLGRSEVMAARAEIGYASMLLYRSLVAGLSGHRINPVFEARVVAESAADKLRRLPADVPERRDALFDAYVTLALAWQRLDADQKAAETLEVARRLDPSRADEDARFLFVTGEVSPSSQLFDSGRISTRLLYGLQAYRRAVERDPKFEVAQFSLAYATEALWRTRGTLERDAAEMVFREYERVIELNPGNLGAWANRAHMRWLLGDLKRGDLERSREDFERGRDYKEIKHETFVAELDYGLARIAAEEAAILTDRASQLIKAGASHAASAEFARASEKLSEAYRYYISAVSAHLAQGVLYGASYTEYFFYLIGDAMFARYRAYRQRMEDQREQFEAQGIQDPPKRVRDSVYAFVLNDYGDACYYYFLRSGDERWKQEAREAYRGATRKNPGYVMPYYNLHLLDGSADPQYIEMVNKLAPTWPDGQLALAEKRRDQIREYRAQIEAYEAKAKWRQDNAGAAHAGQTLSHLARGFASLARFFRRPMRKSEGDAGDERQTAEEPGGIRGDASRWGTEIGTGGDARHVVAQIGGGRRAGPSGMPAVGSAKQPEDLLQLNKQQKDADALEKERREAAARDADAREAAREIEGIIRTLLPHGWLWGTRAGGTKEDFAWDALERREVVDELRWEREFDLLHVRALFTWANTVLLREKQFAQAQQLLRHIETHFWPGNFDLLWVRRRLLENERQLRKNERDLVKPAVTTKSVRSLDANIQRLDQEIQELDRDIECLNWRIREIVKRWVTDDPENQRALQWVTDEAFGAPARQRVFSRVLHEALPDEGPRLFPFLYEWLGDQVMNLTGADPDDASKAYRRGIAGYRKALRDDGAPLLGTADHEAFCHYQIGRALWKLREYDRAIEELKQVPGDSRMLGPEWRTKLVDELLGSMRSREDYQAMRTWLEQERQRTQTAQDSAARQDVCQASLRLFRAKYAALGRRSALRQTDTSAAEWIAPITLGASPALFPSGDAWWKEHKLFNEHLPNMQERVRDKTGFTLPRVLVRAYDLSRDAYILMVHDVPVGIGKVEPEQRFCPDYEVAQSILGPAAAGIPPAFNPQTGKPDGLWIPQSRWGSFASESRLLWDPFEYMVRHLERVLWDHLASFVGVEEVKTMLDAWAGSGEDERALIQKALPDEAARVRLVQVLRRLVTERVPINDLRIIVTTFADANTTSPELSDVVERLRPALRTDLPGNDEKHRLIAISLDVERAMARWVSERDGKRFLALPPQEAQTFLAAVRDRGAGPAEDLALVIRTPHLRPFVRRLVEVEFPLLPVLAESELEAGPARLGEVSEFDG